MQIMKFNQLTGLELTWEILHTMWLTRFSSLCSMADFVALACVEVTDYTMEQGEIEGCMFTVTAYLKIFIHIFLSQKILEQSNRILFNGFQNFYLIYIN